jgi:hypothetical protein
MFYAVVIQMTDAAATAPAAATADTTPMSPSLARTSRNDKRERKQTAQTLPDGLTHNMMNKYVVYYREIVNLKNGKRIPREYFKVESHPKLNKPWVTSKSTKVSLLEKLQDANEYVTKLSASASESEAASEPSSATDPATATQLPKYTMLRVVRNTPTGTILSLVYDRKDNVNGFRWTCSHTFLQATGTVTATAMATATTLELQYLRDKLREKYGLDLLGMV